MSADIATSHPPREYRELSGRLLSLGARFLQIECGPDAISGALAQLVETEGFRREELLMIRALPMHRKWKIAAGLLRVLRIDPISFVHRCLGRLGLSPECLSDADWATIHFWLAPHCPTTTTDQ